MTQDSYMGNYIFEVKLGIFLNLSFSRISNLSGELEYETVGEGGNNDKMVFLNKPHRRSDRIVFEKGMQTGVSDALYAFISEGVKINNIMIFVKKCARTEKIFWIDQGIVTKRSFSDLDALRGTVLIKSMELAHTGLIELAV
ncbi:phage tail protein [Enterocloster lavalensis]|uniref:Conserved hypothetical phage tail region protein n=1 Tax=Enterocloster lavalensis TaxID=460384 RepID=A0A1I0IWV7_9FIRM|nr:phage tail protein [Enterocloster lavalensis]SEU01801.1 conserved hypothetical phage tail region protein [Enterocloster lavalensis]